MKHYVVSKDHAHCAKPTSLASERVQQIDVILRCEADRASAEPIVEFYRALNALVDTHNYVVNLRVLCEEPVGGPLYWAGRTALFWGDFEFAWAPVGAERSWVAQVLNLAPRSLLVGGAVMLLAQIGGSGRMVAAIHPSFDAAARESGITNSGTATHLSAEGRTHSANTRLSALRLMANLVSLDHGEHLADTLRRYVGLAEPDRKIESQVANQLIRRASADKLVVQTMDIMLENIEDPLRISELSDLVGTSVRQLQRRFLLKTGAKLLATYQALRLERAGGLLAYSDMQLIEIASATGFSSRSAMSRAFVRHYGLRPERVREQRFLGKAPV